MGVAGPGAGDGLGHDGAGPGASERAVAIVAGARAYRIGELDAAESRRRFLKAVGIAAAVAAVSGVAGRLLTSRRAVTAAREAVALPAPVSTKPVLPAGVQVDGASPYVSSNKDFYRIDTALYPPQVDPATWEQLLQRPMIERYLTLACVSNEVGGDLIGNALWLGTPIKALLEEAGPLAGADQVIQRSSDGWITRGRRSRYNRLAASNSASFCGL